MKSIILYGSRYGSARRYAQELSKQTGIPAVGYRDIPSLSGHQTIVYIGALYAGGVLGLARTLRSLSLRDGQRLVIVAVGLADPDIPQNRENIRNSLQKQIPAQLYGRAAVFHLRGAIDYQALSLGHRTMMALLHPLTAKETGGRMERRRQGVNGNLRQAGRFCRFRFPAADYQ